MTHLPRPTPTFHNKTVIHEPDVQMFPDNCETENDENEEIDEIENVEMKQFSFDDFDTVEVEMEEIIPPPRVLAGS